MFNKFKATKPEIKKYKSFTVYRNKSNSQSVYEITSGIYMYTLKGMNICCIAKKAPNGYILRLNNGDEIIIDKEFYEYYTKILKGELNVSV